MRNAPRKRNEPHARAEEPKDPHAGSVSPLLQRLLQRIAGERQEEERSTGEAPKLPRAGRRSGSGAESVTPYLDETRNSRPAPLE